MDYTNDQTRRSATTDGFLDVALSPKLLTTQQPVVVGQLPAFTTAAYESNSDQVRLDFSGQNLKIDE